METPHTADILSEPLTQTTDPLHCHSHINMFSQKSFYDRSWMEKMIGEHPENPEAFIPFLEMDVREIFELIL